MDFIILKVNGTDLSEASHEDTVKAFYSAEEPIIVEVLRRPAETNQDDYATQHSTTMTQCQNSIQSMNNNVSAASLNNTDTPSLTSSVCKKMNSQATQTDPFIDMDIFQQFFRAPSPPPLTRADLTTDDHTSNSTSEQSYDILNDDTSTTYEMEYLDVCLQRLSSSDRVGLTLSYGPPDANGVTDIFIGDVEPNSIAGRDGRIQEGDQILQINGCDVHTREQAIRLFSESRSDITLLVCRPSNQLDDGFVDELGSFQTDGAEIKYSDGTQKHMTLSLIKEDPEEKYEEEDSLLTDTATLPSQKEKEGKDSGVGHDSDRQNELSDQDYDSPQYEIHNSNYTDHEYQELEEFGDLRQALEARCTANKEKIVDLQMIYKQMEALYKLIEQQQAQIGNSKSHELSNSRSVPKMGTRLMSNGDSSIPTTPSKSSETSPESTFKITSPSHSVYETTNTNHIYSETKPSPVTLELGKIDSGSRLSLISEHLYDVISIAPSITQQQVSQSTKLVDTHTVDLPHPNELRLRDDSQESRRSRESSASSSRKQKHKTRKSSDSKTDTKQSKTPKHAMNGHYPDIVYTNEENLALTIELQQRLLLEQVKQSQRPSKNQEYGATNGVTNTINDSGPQKEWVLKRGRDGSRYVTCRPIRRKLLSDRKKKLEDERCGMTTDDDAMSEMKTGRYWSKEDRKSHMMKAKEYRKRKEIMKNKMETLREPDEKLTDKLVKKGQKVREISDLTLPAKIAGRANNNNIVLSVTTV